jgi:hypothetical protein
VGNAIRGQKFGTKWQNVLTGIDMEKTVATRQKNMVTTAEIEKKFGTR